MNAGLPSPKSFIRLPSVFVLTFIALFSALTVEASVTAVDPTPSVTLSATTGAPGAPVTATIANGPGYPTDWVALFATGAPAADYQQWQYLNGTHTAPTTGLSGGTLTFTLPMTPGTYELRFFLSGSNTVLATSVPITVVVPAPSVTPSATTGALGAPVTATIANGPGYPRDWVALFATGAPATDYQQWQYLNGTHTAPATGLSGGTLTFTLPLTPGTYELRFFLNGSNTVLAMSAPITVLVPSLTLSATTGAPGAPVTVTIANGPGYPTDWVALFATGAPAADYQQWQYLNGTHTAPTTGLSGGTLTFTLPLTAGTYELRFFLNGSNTVLATSVRITVVVPTPSVTLSATTGAPGAPVTATIANGPGYPTDWVALFATGDPVTNYQAWQYLNGTHTAPATGLSGGTLTFTLPLTPGTYELRFFLNGSNTVLATSAPITVVTPPVISAVAAAAITPSGATIGWTTNQASDSQVDFGLTTAYGSTSALNAALVTTHTVSLTGLTSATVYHVRVRSRNAAGSLAVSGDVTFTTLDNTPPTVSITAPAAGTTISGTATVTATAADNVGVAGVQFAVDGVPLGAEITAAPYTAPWITQGSTDLVFGVVKVAVGPMTISAGSGLTKRLGVSCPSCTGDDTASVDKIQATAGTAAATFTFSTPAHYLAQVAAFKAATTPGYLQGAAATTNVAGTSLVKAFAAPTTAGSLVVAAVAWQGTAPLTVTDSQGNSYAVATTAYDAALGQSVAILYAANVTAGATTVTAGFGTASPTVKRLEIHEYAGVATTSPLDGTATNIAEGTTTADTVTSGAAATTVITPVTDGSHTLTAVARDAAGNTATSAAVTVTVLNDVTPPAVSITAPAAGAFVTGPVTVTANASDNIGVVGVQFKLDGASLGAEDTTSPYSVSWNTTTASNASHTLTAVARDAAGNQTTSAAVTVTVSNDTTPPVISAVTVSSILSSVATITWTTDEVSDSEVEYGLTTAYGGFSTLDVSLVIAHSMIVGALAPSTVFHFRVRSRDAAGNLALSGDFTLTTLEGIPPSVSITAPAGGATVSGSIPVTASASDNVGVVGVQFQLDGAVLGAEDLTSPYSVSWNTTAAANGSHTLTAIARDAAGNRTTSAVVTVTVANLTGQVALAWDASTDPTLVGYKVYVGTASGVYSVSVVDVGNVTSHTVTGLLPGSVYYFAVTGYDLAGAESSFSNEVSATIP